MIMQRFNFIKVNKIKDGYQLSILLG